MRRLFLLLLCGLAGCQTFVKPFEPRRPVLVDDPCLSPSEQERKSRYLLAFPDTELGPRSGGEQRPVLGPHNQ